MARVSTYLNFMGTTEEAFAFYREVFGTEYIRPATRMGDMPMPPGAPQLSEAEQAMIMHVELPILAGHVLMGTDMLRSMGHELKVGNNVTINLELDSREEAERLAQLRDPAHRLLAQLWLAIGDAEKAKNHALASYKWA